MSIGAGRITVSCVAGAILWAVGGLNRRTSSFVTSGSNARVPGGTRSTAIRCWRFAVRSTMGHWIRWLCGINSGNEACKNYLMLPVRSSQCPTNFFSDQFSRHFGHADLPAGVHPPLLHPRAGREFAYCPLRRGAVLTGQGVRRGDTA